MGETDGLCAFEGRLYKAAWLRQPQPVRHGLNWAVAVRQVVGPVPWPLARKPDLARGVLAIALREVQRWLQRSDSLRKGAGPSVLQVSSLSGSIRLALPSFVRCIAMPAVLESGGMRW